MLLKSELQFWLAGLIKYAWLWSEKLLPKWNNVILKHKCLSYLSCPLAPINAVLNIVAAFCLHIWNHTTLAFSSLGEEGNKGLAVTWASGGSLWALSYLGFALLTTKQRMFSSASRPCRATLAWTEEMYGMKLRREDMADWRGPGYPKEFEDLEAWSNKCCDPEEEVSETHPSGRRNKIYVLVKGSAGSATVVTQKCRTSYETSWDFQYIESCWCW